MWDEEALGLVATANMHLHEEELHEAPPEGCRIGLLLGIVNGEWAPLTQFFLLPSQHHNVKKASHSPIHSHWPQPMGAI